jgi:thioredoxin 1
MKAILIDVETLSKMMSEGKELLVLFTAGWCGYCATLKRELDASPHEFDLYEVDISDESCPAWEDYGIMTVPTALFFKDGKEHSRKVATFTGLKVIDIKALPSNP